MQKVFVSLSRNQKNKMKKTISQEDVMGVLQSSITNVSSMFPSIFTKDDVIRLLNEIQSKVEELPVGTEQEVNPQKQLGFDISYQNNIEMLCKNVIESIDEYVMQLDFREMEIELEFDTNHYENEITVSAQIDKSSLSNAVYDKFRFDTLHGELLDSVTDFVAEQIEKEYLKDKSVKEN